jgi:integrase/recombinase XerD
MNLLVTDNSFLIEGFPYPDIPFLLDKEMCLVEPANRFLIYTAIHRGMSPSKRTWKTYAAHLFDYFSFLEANSRKWNEDIKKGSPTIVAIYRNWSMNRVKSQTVNHRLGTIVRFYKFAHENRWIKELPWDMDYRVIKRGNSFLAHTASGSKKAVPNVMLKNTPRVIEVLTSDQIGRLLRKLKPNRTHFLIAKLALASGMRKEELMSFPLSYVFDPKTNVTPERSIKITLKPSDMEIKGSRTRHIFIPKSLMAELWDYVIFERGKICSDCELVGNKPEKTLFLSNQGKRYSPSSFNKALERAGEQIGFHVHPHVLRHSYATHELYAMSKAKGSPMSGLLWVKERLGHSSIHTTEQYLHVLDGIEYQYLEEYQYDLDKLLGEVK